MKPGPTSRKNEEKCTSSPAQNKKKHFMVLTACKSFSHAGQVGKWYVKKMMTNLT
uniref:Uncharacterized protein n=1 Tax=Arion vulgaris TaxID=1028688 RepID=A0A0B6ZZ72_9EUPU